MAIDLGFTLLKNIFVDTYIFNIDWLLSAVITFLSLLWLSKDPNEWKTLAFPVMVGWHIAGLSPFFLLYIATAMMYAIESLSLQTIGQVITGVTRTATEKWKGIKPSLVEEEHKRITRRQKRRTIKDILGERSFTQKELLKKRGILSDAELQRLRRLSGGGR